MLLRRNVLALSALSFVFLFALMLSAAGSEPGPNSTLESAQPALKTLELQAPLLRFQRLLKEREKAAEEYRKLLEQLRQLEKRSEQLRQLERRLDNRLWKDSPLLDHRDEIPLRLPSGHQRT